jgi:tetratricopeptide (TPR) repeat protein
LHIEIPKKPLPEYEPVEFEYWKGIRRITRFDNRIADSIECFYACLRLNPRYFGAIFNLAAIFYNISYIPLAKKWFKLALESDSQNDQCKLFLSICYFVLEKFEKGYKVCLKMGRESLFFQKIFEKNFQSNRK